MEEEDHFTQTLLSLLSHTHYCTRQQGCCPWQPFFLSWYLYCTHNLSAQFAMLSWCLFIGKNGATSSNSSSTKVAANSNSSWIMVAANLWHLGWVHMVGATPVAGPWQWQPSPRVGLLPHKWQYPNNHPFCHLCRAIVLLLFQHRFASYSSSKLTILIASSAKFTWYLPHLSITRVTKAHLFSHKRITTTRWSATSHLKSVNACLWDTTFPFKRINHSRSGMIHHASHQGLQHPLKQKFLFPSATVIIWVSQYDRELTTLPRVYSSRSRVCPLFHPRNHALLLHKSLTLSPKSPGSSPPSPMGATH